MSQPFTPKNKDRGTCTLFFTTRSTLAEVGNLVRARGTRAKGSGIQSCQSSLLQGPGSVHTPSYQAGSLWNRISVTQGPSPETEQLSLQEETQSQDPQFRVPSPPTPHRSTSHYYPQNCPLQVFTSVSQFSCSVMSDSLRPHESQHARPPCPSPTPRVYSNSCPSSR